MMQSEETRDEEGDGISISGAMFSMQYLHISILVRYILFQFSILYSAFEMKYN